MPIGFVLALFYQRQLHLFAFTDYWLLFSCHWPLFSRPTPHALRPTPHTPCPTIFGGRRRCRAPSRVRHPHPEGPTCYDMLRFPLPAEVWRAMFSAQVNIE